MPVFEGQAIDSTPSSGIVFPGLLVEEDEPKRHKGLKKGDTVHNIGVTGGRVVRTATAGGASIADLPLLVPKTLAAGGEFLLEKAGAEGTPVEQFLQKIRTTPTMRDTAVQGIDEATGGVLQPQNLGEKIIMGGGELAVPFGFYSKTGQMQRGADKAPGIIDAVRGVLNPMESVETAVKAAMPVPKKMTQVRKMTAEDLRQAANQSYKTAEARGGSLKSSVTDDLLDKVQAMQPQTKAGQSVAGESEVTKLIERMQGMRGQPLTLRAAQEIDEGLSNLITYDTGKITKEGLAIKKIQELFRETIENADRGMITGGKQGFEALKEGRNLWSRYVKMRDVERVLERAVRMDQPAMGIKSGFRTLLGNPNRLKGYSAAEIKAMEKAAETGMTVEILRVLGSRLNPIIVQSIGAGTGGILAGAPGAIAGVPLSYGVSAGARRGATSLQTAKAQRVIDTIAQGGRLSTAPPPMTPTQYGVTGTSIGVLSRGQQ